MLNSKQVIYCGFDPSVVVCTWVLLWLCPNTFKGGHKIVVLVGNWYDGDPVAR